MAKYKATEELHQRMYDAALAAADEFHRGNAKGRMLKAVAQAYYLTATALADRARDLLSEAKVDPLEIDRLLDLGD